MPHLFLPVCFSIQETQHWVSGVCGQAAMPRATAAKHTGKGNVPFPYLLNLSTPAKENLLSTRTATLWTAHPTVDGCFLIYCPYCTANRKARVHSLFFFFFIFFIMYALVSSFIHALNQTACLPAYLSTSTIYIYKFPIYLPPSYLPTTNLHTNPFTYHLSTCLTTCQPTYLLPNYIHVCTYLPTYLPLPNCKSAYLTNQQTTDKQTNRPM